MSKPLRFYSLSLGCDPEFFFRREGKVIGADKVIPTEGILVGGSKVIIDGVQAELNPSPSYCRQILSGSIGQCFVALKHRMSNMIDIGIDFAQTIKLSDEEFEELTDDSKKFGCMPSKNSFDGGKEGKISIDQKTYRFRSAGGHIHIGNTYYKGIDTRYEKVDEILHQPERVVKMLDLLVGNTCVLIDRDPGNIERRKVYGRAGEFRTPPHGVEYRTLSNFWLGHPILMSFVMGLTRQAINIVANDRDDEFLALVNMQEVAKAINENDYNLALANFEKIESLLLDTCASEDYYPLTKDKIVLFKHFVHKGLSHWFKEDPLEVWTTHNSRMTGFENFLIGVVASDLVASKAKE